MVHRLSVCFVRHLAHSHNHTHIMTCWLLTSHCLPLMPTPQSNGHIPFGIKLSYALPQFSLTSLTMLIGIHGTLFYTQIGANVALIAFFTALARSFDVITDPVMGYMSDKTRTKYGRRRPYMVLGSWGYALMFILLFSPPLFESACCSCVCSVSPCVPPLVCPHMHTHDYAACVTGGESIALWFGFFYVLFYLFDTVGNVPYVCVGGRAKLAALVPCCAHQPDLSSPAPLPSLPCFTTERAWTGAVRCVH